MAAIITEKFRLHNAEQFYESFSEASKNVYYLMIGKSTPFSTTTSGGTDGTPPTPADDVSSNFYEWDQSIALKNIAYFLNINLAYIWRLGLQHLLVNQLAI